DARRQRPGLRVPPARGLHRRDRSRQLPGGAADGEDAGRRVRRGRSLGGVPLDPRRGMTALDLVEALLLRLAQSDPAVWIDRTDPAALRARAAELDAVPVAARGALPLWGWTGAVKGNIDVAGWRTT